MHIDTDVFQEYSWNIVLCDRFFFQTLGQRTKSDQLKAKRKAALKARLDKVKQRNRAKGEIVEEEGDNDHQEEEEDANLTFAERAQKRAYKKLHKLRREGNKFVLTSREKHAMEDMLAGYNAQGALDLAEKRKSADVLEQVKSNAALDRLNRMVAKYPPPQRKWLKKLLSYKKNPNKPRSSEHLRKRKQYGRQNLLLN